MSDKLKPTEAESVGERERREQEVADVTLPMQDEPDPGMYYGASRITLVRREGNKVFVRTLRPDEDPETAVPARVRKGERLVFEPGALAIGVEVLDKPAVEGRGGYAPVSGTVWRSNRILLKTHPEQLRRRLLVLARKLDATFILWSSVMDSLEEQNAELPQVTQLHLLLNVLAQKEELFVPLAKALKIVRELSDAYSVSMPSGTCQRW